MELSELLQPFFLKRAAACFGLGLLLFGVVWVLGGKWKAPLTLAALGAGWIACHLALSILSGIFPPKEPSDWLVPACGALILLAGLFAFHQSHLRLMAVAAAVLLAVTFWKVLGQIPYLLTPGEAAADRQQWTLIALGALIAVFACAEWLARGLPPVAVTASLSVFAAAAALGLWKLGSQDRMVMLPAALALMLAGAGLPSLNQRCHATIPPGWAGWFAGGVFILYVRAALSRADSVPLIPMAAAAAAIPAAAVFLALWRRTRLGGNGFASVAAVLMAGAGVFWYSAAEQQRMNAAPPALSTGADDTGAYEGL